jgi:hypothetical protein
MPKTDVKLEEDPYLRLGMNAIVYLNRFWDECILRYIKVHDDIDVHFIPFLCTSNGYL